MPVLNLFFHKVSTPWHKVTPCTRGMKDLLYNNSQLHRQLVPFFGIPVCANGNKDILNLHFLEAVQ